MKHFTPESFLPIHGMYPAVLDWLEDEDATRWQDALRYSVTFSEQSIDPGEQELRDLWPSGARLSWLGGPAVGTGAWAVVVSPDPLGVDLAGVVTVDVTVDVTGNAEENAEPAGTAAAATTPPPWTSCPGSCRSRTATNTG